MPAALLSLLSLVASDVMAGAPRLEIGAGPSVQLAPTRVEPTHLTPAVGGGTSLRLGSDLFFSTSIDVAAFSTAVAAGAGRRFRVNDELSFAVGGGGVTAATLDVGDAVAPVDVVVGIEPFVLISWRPCESLALVARAHMPLYLSDARPKPVFYFTLEPTFVLEPTAVDDDARREDPRR